MEAAIRKNHVGIVQNSIQNPIQNWSALARPEVGHRPLPLLFNRKAVHSRVAHVFGIDLTGWRCVTLIGLVVDLFCHERIFAG
jgi:hypothetical protein